MTLSPSLDSSAGRTVSDPITETATTRIVPVAIEREGLVSGQVHARHRGDHGQAGDQHGAARGRRGRLQRCLLAASGSPLLALAAHVEQRVVDADGHPDQQHDLGHGRVDREDLADQRDQSERGAHAGDRKQHRDAGGDQRPEREDQDHQRDRERQRASLGEVVAEALVERLVRARVAGLLDRQAGMRALSRRGGRQRIADPLVSVRRVAADLESDQRRVPVMGDLTAVGSRQRRAQRSRPSRFPTAVRRRL